MAINKPAVFAAFNSFAAVTNDAVKRLRTSLIALGVTTAEDARPLVLEWASTSYACPIVVSASNRNKGQLVLDRSAPSFHAAEKAAKRLMDNLTGDADETVSAKDEGEAAEAEEDFDIPAEVAAAAAKLVELVLAYDMKKGALRKMASRAVAESFAAKSK